MSYQRGLLPDPLDHVAADTILGRYYEPREFGAPGLSTTHNRDVDDPPIRDQQRTNFCVRFAGCEAIRFARAKAGWPVYPLSPLFIAYDSSMPGYAGQNEGTTISTFARAARAVGVTSEDQEPWLPSYLSDLRSRPSADSYDVAERHRVIDDARLPDRMIDTVVAALQEGWPVQIGRPVDQAYEDVPHDTGIYQPGGTYLGLHSTLIVDIDQVNGRWVFVERNSWGDLWGMDGYCYTPVDDAIKWSDCRIYRGVSS